MTRTNRTISSVGGGGPDWDMNKIEVVPTGVPIEKDGVITFVIVSSFTYHFHVAINSKSDLVQSFGSGADATNVRASTIIRVSKGDILYVGYSAGDSANPPITWAADGSTIIKIKNDSGIEITSARWKFYPLK